MRDKRRRKRIGRIWSIGHDCCRISQAGDSSIGCLVRDKRQGDGATMPDNLVVAVMWPPPVFLDLAAATERALQIICVLGRDGAELIVFPET